MSQTLYVVLPAWQGNDADKFAVHSLMGKSIDNVILRCSCLLHLSGDVGASIEHIAGYETRLLNSSVCRACRQARKKGAVVIVPAATPIEELYHLQEARQHSTTAGLPMQVC